jgi:hypothetical protein
MSWKIFCNVLYRIMNEMSSLVPQYSSDFLIKMRFFPLKVFQGSIGLVVKDCLPLNLGIMGSSANWVMTMFLHMTPILVGSRKANSKVFNTSCKNLFYNQT